MAKFYTRATQLNKNMGTKGAMVVQEFSSLTTNDPREVYFQNGPKLPRT